MRVYWRHPGIEPMRALAASIMLAILAVAMSAGEAEAAPGHAMGRAHGGHFHGHSRPGAHFVAPLWLPPIAAAPYYDYYFYNPPLLTVPPPTVYVQQDVAPAEGAAAQGMWYYCADPQGYYPSVEQCPGGWQQVSPQPTAPEPAK